MMDGYIFFRGFKRKKNAKYKYHTSIFVLFDTNLMQNQVMKLYIIKMLPKNIWRNKFENFTF